MIGVSGILARLIKSYGLEDKLLEYSLRRQWNGIVGEGIAAHTIPAKIQYHRLYLWVDSLIWVHQLTLLKPMLLQKINAYCNRHIFKDIILKTGHPPMTLPDPPQPDPSTWGGSDQNPVSPHCDLTPDLELCINEYLRPLGDQKLKEVLRRVMIKSLTSPPPVD